MATVNRLLLTLLAFMFVGMDAFAQKRADGTQSDRRILVAYFSATGTTAAAAKKIAQATGGELYEIQPAVPYTAADLDWHNDRSRSSVEMNDPASRPALKGKKADIGRYDVVYIGYPIWWGKAPAIINTFIEAHDLKGKVLVPFATSGGSRIDNSVDELKKSYPNLNWKAGKLLNRMSGSAIAAWVKESAY